MSREEAIAFADSELKAAYERAEKIGYKRKTRYIEVLEMAIQALEQEPCEDAISRAKAMTEIMMNTNIREHLDGNLYIKVADAVQILRDLSSIKPQEPKTVIYSGDGYADGYMVYDMAECPNCGYEYDYGDKDWGLSFCPSCGQALNWESEVEE